MHKKGTRQGSAHHASSRHASSHHASSPPAEAGGTNEATPATAPSEGERRRARERADNPRAEALRQADLHRRMRAAGLDPNDAPEDIEVFRAYLARKISMFLNDWHGCPHGWCQRMRGCMAPDGDCANTADKPEMTQEEWDEARFGTRRILDQIIAERGGIEAMEAGIAAEEKEAKEAKEREKKKRQK